MLMGVISLRILVLPERSELHRPILCLSLSHCISSRYFAHSAPFGIQNLQTREKPSPLLTLGSLFSSASTCFVSSGV